MKHIDLTIVAIMILAAPGAVSAQSNPPTPVIGIVGAIEVPDGDRDDFYMLRLLNPVNTTHVTPSMVTNAGTTVDMDFLKKRVLRYVTNNYVLQQKPGVVIPPAPSKVPVKRSWLLESMIEPGTVVIMDDHVGLVAFDQSGKLEFVVLNGEKDITFADVTIKAEQGRIVDCSADSPGCDTEVYVTVNAERFELIPGRSVAPAHPRIAAVSILRAQRQQVPTSDPWEDLEFMISFMPDFVPRDTQGPFPDVPFQHPYRESIAFVKNEGIVNGYDDGTFKPEKTLNRAEFTKMVIIAAGEGEYDEACNSYPGDLFLFPDTVYGSWYGPYVCVAKYRALIDGYPDGTFKPERTINFVEAAKIVTGALDIPIDGDMSPEWYGPYLRALELYDAVPPTVNDIEQQMTRGELAYILHALVGNAE